MIIMNFLKVFYKELLALGEIRDIKRRLKISRLIKVTYIVSYTVHFEIKAYSKYEFSDGYSLVYVVESYVSLDDVRRHSGRHYLEFRDYVKVKFPTTSPVFEFSNFVTQF